MSEIHSVGKTRAKLDMRILQRLALKSCLARFSGIFALGTTSNIHGTAISHRCAKFGAFVNSVTKIVSMSGATARRPRIVDDLGPWEPKSTKSKMARGRQCRTHGWFSLVFHLFCKVSSGYRWIKQ